MATRPREFLPREFIPRAFLWTVGGTFVPVVLVPSPTVARFGSLAFTPVERYLDSSEPIIGRVLPSSQPTVERYLPDN